MPLPGPLVTVVVPVEPGSVWVTVSNRVVVVAGCEEEGFTIRYVKPTRRPIIATAAIPRVATDEATPRLEKDFPFLCSLVNSRYL